MALVLFLRHFGKVPIPYLFSDEMIEDDERKLEEIEAAEEDISLSLSENQKTYKNMNIQKKTKMDLFKRDKTFSNDNQWSSINQKRINVRNELFERANILDKKDKKKISNNVLENRIPVSDDRKRQKYLCN